MEIIAHIHTDFPEKFGIPRQSGLVAETTGRIVFTSRYREPQAVKGLTGFDYIWLLWQFEGVTGEGFQATVRPPRLGGNTRMGVFATRSPFRPNAIGLSSVKLLGVELTGEGPVLTVAGADLRDNTPIIDIKPYLPYTDSHPDAAAGFTAEQARYELPVDFPEKLLFLLPPEKRQSAIALLGQDPRPSYHTDVTRNYGMAYAGYDIRFTVENGCVKVHEVVKIQ